VTWNQLFEQAAEYEIEEGAVLQALKARRDPANEATEDEP
jgi:hypothetical protein